MAGMDNFSQQVQSGAQVPQQELPLAMRALAANPFQISLTALAGHNIGRFTNTMFEGGFLDTATGASGKRSAVKGFLGRRTGAYAGNAMQDNSAYAMGSAFRKNMPSFTGKMGKNFEQGGRKIKALAANSPLNPFAMRRFDSLARLAGDTSQKGVYTPFQATGMITEKVFNSKGKLGKVFRGKFADEFSATGQLGEGKTIYSGGVFGRINTMGKIMDYEKQVAAAARLPSGSANLTRAQSRVAIRGEKAAAKLAKLDQNIIKLGMQTGADFAQVGANVMTPFGAVAKTGAAQADEIGAAAQKLGRLRAVSQTSKGFVSRRILDYAGTIMGRGAQFEGTKAFTNTANTFAKAMKSSRIGFSGGAMTNVDTAGHYARTAYGAAGYADDDAYLLKLGNTKMIRQTAGKLGMEAFARREFGTAAKMAVHYTGTHGKFAMKAFNVVGTASIVYDLGKGVGKMMMGGVNLGKDALKSMQGSINKPLFGAGFKDNEVAATSRSRGVMAIQNSRLNARSALGSEGAMMAAHFG
jgi:hypothetical protein